MIQEGVEGGATKKKAYQLNHQVGRERSRRGVVGAFCGGFSSMRGIWREQREEQREGLFQRVKKAWI